MYFSPYMPSTRGAHEQLKIQNASCKKGQGAKTLGLKHGQVKGYYCIPVPSRWSHIAIVNGDLVAQKKNPS